jgi:hypothetical protein
LITLEFIILLLSIKNAYSLRKPSEEQVFFHQVIYAVDGSQGIVYCCHSSDDSGKGVLGGSWEELLGQWRCGCPL